MINYIGKRYFVTEAYINWYREEVPNGVSFIKEGDVVTCTRAYKNGDVLVFNSENHIGFGLEPELVPTLLKEIIE